VAVTISSQGCFKEQRNTKKQLFSAEKKRSYRKVDEKPVHFSHLLNKAACHFLQERLNVGGYERPQCTPKLDH